MSEILVMKLLVFLEYLVFPEFLVPQKLLGVAMLFMVFEELKLLKESIIFKGVKIQEAKVFIMVKLTQEQH